MKNLFDRFWWFCNRKPNSPTTTYFAVVGPWIIIGLIFLLGLLTITASITEAPTKVLLMGIGIVVIAALLGVFGFLWDKKHGYVRAIHEAYITYRNEVAKRLGKEA